MEHHVAATTVLTPFDEQGLTAGDGSGPRIGVPASLTVDGTHHLALVDTYDRCECETHRLTGPTPRHTR